MKKLFLILLIFNLQSSIFNFALAQAPQAIPYQAVARDNSGTPIASQAISLRFTIHEVTAVGGIVYQETQSKTTNSFGLFTANIGEGMAGSGTFATIEWDAGAKFMQVEMDAAGGNAYVDMGTQQMLSVPYALYAGSAGRVAVDATPILAGENNIPSVQIPDNSCTGITSTISVSGQDVSVSSARITVTLDITHTFDGDLYIYLIAPNGSVLCLASAIGSSGDNFTNTTFSDAATTNIISGTPPFSGTFKPSGNLFANCSLTPTTSTFADIGGGSIDPNGTWSLTIFDLAGIDVGILNSWSISIGGFTGSNANYVPKWNNTSSLVPSAIYDNGNVGINTEAPEASAQLEVSSTTKGFLPPRMTAAERDAIANPVAGLVVYCTNCGTNGGELQVHNGSSWRNMVGDPAAIVLAIGQVYQGGTIAYILQPGDPGYDAAIPHGLIAAPTDQSSGTLWGCAGTLISGADGDVIGTGNQNTIDIMNGCVTAGIAARICGDLVLGGYSDWFLPSIDELHLLYLNIGNGAPAPNTNVGGFVTDITGIYWSSTEAISVSAYVEAFYPGGGQNTDNKNTIYRVRAVRYF